MNWHLESIFHSELQKNENLAEIQTLTKIKSQYLTLICMSLFLINQNEPAFCNLNILFLSLENGLQKKKFYNSIMKF